MSNWKKVHFVKDMTLGQIFCMIVWISSCIVMSVGIITGRVDLITLALVMNLYSNQDC